MAGDIKTFDCSLAYRRQSKSWSPLGTHSPTLLNHPGERFRSWPGLTPLLNITLALWFNVGRQVPANLMSLASFPSRSWVFLVSFSRRLGPQGLRKQENQDLEKEAVGHDLGLSAVRRLYRRWSSLKLEGEAPHGPWFDRGPPSATFYSRSGQL